MKKGLGLIFLAGLGVIVVMPVILVIINSFMTPAEITQRYYENAFLISLVPQKITLKQYYILLIERVQYLGMFWRSIKIAMSIVVGQLIYSLIMGIIINHLSSKIQKTIYVLYIIGLLIPYQVIMLPLYIQAKTLGLLGADASIILPALFAPLGVIFMGQVIKNVPLEIIEAVQLETNSIIIIFKTAILPYIKGALVALSIFSFAEAWNMIEQPIHMFTNQNQYPLSVRLAYMNQDSSIVFAGCVIYMLPIMILYFYFEESLLENLIEVKW